MELCNITVTGECYWEDAHHDDAGDIDEAGSLGLDELFADVEEEVGGIAGLGYSDDVLFWRDGVKKEESTDDDHNKCISYHSVELHWVAFIVKKFSCK